MKRYLKIDREREKQPVNKKYMQSERSSAFVFSGDIRHWRSKVKQGKDLF